jgi:hypothetical protein
MAEAWKQSALEEARQLPHEEYKQRVIDILGVPDVGGPKE